MRVIVLGGGTSNEHDVSLRSAAGVAQALRERHEVEVLTIGRNGTWSQDDTALSFPSVIESLSRADVVFPALHGSGGEDGAIQGFLQTLGVPFVGCGIEASAVCMRKDLTKQVLRANGVDVVDGVVAYDSDSAREAFAALGARVVVKPLAEGSSVGVLVAGSAEEVITAVRERPMLVERYAGGQEVDVAVAEIDGARRLGTPLEIIRDAGGVFDLGSKYGGEPPFVLPARLTAAQRARVEAESLRVFDVLGCAGIARVDWFIDGDTFLCNEVNTMPGMTERSQVPLMFADAGTTLPELVDGLVRTAVR